MIIEGANNSSLHVVEHTDTDKMLIISIKECSNGVHKSSKLIVDKLHSFTNNSHSIEISGIHYALISDMDFHPMISRISRSRNYRKYAAQLQGAA